jgi:CBS-domain-containing membrane protein
MFSAIAKANIEHLNNIIDGKKDVHVPTIAEIMKPCIVTSVTAPAEELVDRLDKGNHIVVAIGEHGAMAGIIQSDDIIHVLTA